MSYITHPESVRSEQETPKSRTQFLRGLRTLGNHHISREGSLGMEGAREECQSMMCGERDVLCGLIRLFWSSEEDTDDSRDSSPQKRIQMIAGTAVEMRLAT